MFPEVLVVPVYFPVVEGSVLLHWPLLFFSHQYSTYLCICLPSGGELVNETVCIQVGHAGIFALKFLQKNKKRFSHETYINDYSFVGLISDAKFTKFSSPNFCVHMVVVDIL